MRQGPEVFCPPSRTEIETMFTVLQARPPELLQEALDTLTLLPRVVNPYEVIEYAETLWDLGVAAEELRTSLGLSEETPMRQLLPTLEFVGDYLNPSRP